MRVVQMRAALATNAEGIRRGWHIGWHIAAPHSIEGVGMTRGMSESDELPRFVTGMP